MELKQVSLSGSGFRGKMLTDYLENAGFLKPFYSFRPEENQFAEAIAARRNKPVNRKLLVNELHRQHAEIIERFPETGKNISLLENENTFTVTTGHQLCLGGGPLFFFYKLLTTVNLAESLGRKFPDSHFVPVYWMASEDHDFEEIASVTIGNKTIRWNHESGDATGRLNTSGLNAFFDEVLNMLRGLPGFEKLEEVIRKSYLNSENLAEATRKFVLEFFGRYGVVVIDADQANFKKDFASVMKDELVQEHSFRMVTATNEMLSSQYAVQVTPRPINLFYLHDGIRKRIVKTGDHYAIVDTHIRFSQEEILRELDAYPERFSPNVILRPLYQEFILPNLAYCGGPAETAYWMQFKQVFDHYNIFYPVLIPRGHAIILDEKKWKVWEKLGFGYDDLFKPEEELVRHLLRNLNGSDTISDRAVAQLKAIYEDLATEAGKIDITLEPAVRARMQRALHGLERLEKKFRAALKRKHEVSLRRLHEVKEFVSPAGTPQERVTTFMEMYALYSDDLFDELKNAMQPFSDRLTVIHP